MPLKKPRWTFQCVFHQQNSSSINEYRFIIQLSAENLRSADLQVSGSGLGSWTAEEMKKLFDEIIPAMFQLAADQKLKVETIPVQLKDIESLWSMQMPGGKRLVVLI